MADTTPAPIGADAALAQLVAAVEAETDPGWDCNSYHPSLWPALKAARAALASAAQPASIFALRTDPAKGESPWGGIYSVRADAERDAEAVRKATGRAWEVVPLAEVIDAASPSIAGAAAPHDWRVSPAYGGEICANCGAVKGTSRGNAHCREVAAPTTQAAPAAVAHQGVVVWPVMPPSKRQSPVLFEDGYAEGWAKCLEACRAALAAAPTTQAAPTTKAALQPAAQQGDAEQREVDARHAAIYRWMLSHIADVLNIFDNWFADEEAGTDELHDVLAARAAKEGSA